MSFLLPETRCGLYRCRSAGEKGAAAVELALALPILLFLIFALIQLSLLINARTIMDQAAYEAARVKAVGVDQKTAGDRAAKVLATLPGGAGFPAAEPAVAFSRLGDAVVVQIRAEIRLLPFFRQVAMAAGSDGKLVLISRARAKTEPWGGWRQ